jgi:purine nucleosidase
MRSDWMRGLTAVVLLTSCLTCWAQEKRKIIIDQDAAGPAGTDQQSMLLLIQSPQTEVLGITVVTGDQWLHEEVAHTLRMLELIGRTDIPVVPGAEYPLVKRKQDTEQWEQQYGSVPWLGAWTPRFYHPPDQLGEMPDGKPATKPADEDAAHFLLRMVHKFPNQVTIYAGGPMTNLALAISIDPEFAALAKELVFMGGSFNPRTDDPEFVNTPAHEFNLWFDPEAAHIVLRAPWKKEMLYMDIDLDRGAGYGNTLSWTEQNKPRAEMHPVEVQDDLDLEKFYKMFVDLLTSQTPPKN